VKKPETHAEMVSFMEAIGVSEDLDFLAFIVEEGWAADKKAAVAYLESINIFPWDD
jgi:hypothetical protein